MLNNSKQRRSGRITVIVAVGPLLVLALSCAKQQTTPPVKRAKPSPAIADSQMSLRKESVFEQAKPQPVAQYSKADPGENKKFVRSFALAPPMIPHEASGNGTDCLDCHAQGDDGAPKISATHRLQVQMKAYSRKTTRNGQLYAVDGYKPMPKVVGARLNCKLCHAPQAANLKPLVGNSFKGSGAIAPPIKVLKAKGAPKK